MTDAHRTTEWKSYERKGHIEAAPWVPGFDMTMVSLSQADQGAGHPKEGGMIARNKDVHDDMWYIAQDFFETHYAPRSAPEPAAPTTNSVSGSSKSASPGEPRGEPDVIGRKCPYCEAPADERGVTNHAGGCLGLETVEMNRLQYNNLLRRIAPEPSGEWRPIATAPKDGTAVLLYSPKHGIVEGWWAQVEGGGHPENGPPIYWWESTAVLFEDGPYDAPTYWMPRISPPPTKGAELRDCICSDPENCREPVPGRRCKAGLSVNGSEQ